MEDDDTTPWRRALAEARVTSGTLFAAAVGIATASFGFGALARASDFSLALAVACTASIWALPGQIAFLDVWVKGGGAFMLVLAVALANARFLPMTTSMGVILGMSGRFRPSYLIYSHLMSMVTWAQSLMMRDRLPVPSRLPYFLFFACIAYVAAMCATAAGYLAAGVLPESLALALFLSPAFFLLLVMSGARDRLGRLSYLAGAVAVPLAEILLPGWGLIVGGVIGGTIAFGIDSLIGAGRGS